MTLYSIIEILQEEGRGYSLLAGGKISPKSQKNRRHFLGPPSPTPIAAEATLFVAHFDVLSDEVKKAKKIVNLLARQPFESTMTVMSVFKRVVLFVYKRVDRISCEESFPRPPVILGLPPFT